MTKAVQELTMNQVTLPLGTTKEVAESTIEPIFDFIDRTFHGIIPGAFIGVGYAIMGGLEGIELFTGVLPVKGEGMETV